MNVVFFHMLIFRVDDHAHNYAGLAHRAGDKGDLTKKFDQACVWYRWKGYLSGNLENRCWGVPSGGIGHQRSFKVTTQGHLKKKCDLTKNFDNFVFCIIGKVTCLGP